MDLKKLRYFQKVVESQGFNKAAETIHISQSALSRQIRLLEQELGTPLLERSSKGAQPTEAGRVLLERIDALFHQIDNIRAEVLNVAGQPSGDLNIGLPYSMRQLLARPVIIEFQKRYPKVSINYVEGTSATLREGLLSGKLDIGILSADESTTVLKSTALLRDPMYLIGPPSSQLDMKQPVSLVDVADKPLIMPSKPASFRTILEKALSEHSLKANIIMEINSPLIMDLVSQKVGYSALSSFSLDGYMDNGFIRAAPIKDFSVDWVLTTSQERPITQANQLFQQMILRKVQSLFR